MYTWLTFRRLGRSTRHRFTLVELLAAMAVLVVMMFMLFRFISGAQEVWAVSNASNEVYEKARIAFDIITRDLQSAVARSDDDGNGNDIRFQQVDVDEMRFVSAGVIGSRGSTSSPADLLLCEVGYKWEDNAFKRATINSTHTDYDLYKDRTGPESCINGQTGFQEVVGGVLELDFDCYDHTMAEHPWFGAGLETGVPYAVDVRIRIMDDKSMERWQLLDTAGKARLESQVALTFSKMVFLPGRE